MKTGRPGRDRLEEGGQEPLPDGIPGHGERGFQDQKQDGAGQNENERGGHNELEMKGGPRRTAGQLGRGDLPHLPQHGKADAAEHDEAGHGHDDPGVAAIGDETIREKGEARVAEGRDGMEHRQSGGPPGPEVRREPGEQQGGTNGLDRHRIHENAPDQGRQVARDPRMKGRLDEESFPKGDPSSGREDDQGREGHDTQTAELNERENHGLAGRGKVGRRVLDDEPGDAHCGGGREKGVKNGRPTLMGRERQAEDERADEDGRKEAQG